MHAFVALQNNIQINYVQCSLEQGFVKLEEKPNILLTDKDFEIYAIICYAGAAAEKIFTGEVHAGCVGYDGTDFEEAERYIRKSLLLSDKHEWIVAVGAEFDSELQKQSKVLYERAYQLIYKHQESVKLLAETLKYRETMTGEEIREFLMLKQGQW